jgi:uncharacterized cupredoxin-like copper-binding protein
MRTKLSSLAFAPVLAAALALSGCAGPAAQAKPTVAPAAAGPVGAPAPAKPPGPYTANGEADASSGKAALQLLDTMKYQPNTLTNAKAGSTLTVDLKNAGATVHSIVAPQMGIPTKKEVPAGGSASVTLTVPSQPGTYFFWCPEPGHAEAGMVGEVQVK